MSVERLDHVNIVTDRLDETARFYCELLDLEKRDGPAPMRPEHAQWMHDASGQAVLHLNHLDMPRRFDRPFEKGAETGAIHHVALRCTDFAKIEGRLKARGAEYRVNDVPSIRLRQIFTRDPNNVLLELNFFDAD